MGAPKRPPKKYRIPREDGHSEELQKRAQIDDRVGSRQARQMGLRKPMEAHEMTDAAIQLTRQAITQRWQITTEDRDKALSKLRALMECGEPKLVLNAVNALLSAERQNQADEHVKAARQHEHTHTVELRAIQDEIRSDPQYLEYLRESQDETHEDPS